MANTNLLFICRELKKSDIEQVSIIEEDAFPELFPQTQFKKELQRTQSTILVSKVNELNPKSIKLMPSSKNLYYKQGKTGWKKGDDFLTGFLTYWELFDEIHIMAIGVRREYTKLKIASLLLSECINNIIKKSFNKINLEVRKSNIPAIGLYTNFGFEIVGERKKFYPDNHENALIMSLSPILSEEYKYKIKEIQKTIESKSNSLFLD